MYFLFVVWMNNIWLLNNLQSTLNLEGLEPSYIPISSKYSPKSLIYDKTHSVNRISIHPYMIALQLNARNAIPILGKHRHRDTQTIAIQFLFLVQKYIKLAECPLQSALTYTRYAAVYIYLCKRRLLTCARFTWSSCAAPSTRLHASLCSGSRQLSAFYFRSIDARWPVPKIFIFAQRMKSCIEK